MLGYGQCLVTIWFKVDGLRPGHAVRCDVIGTYTQCVHGLEVGVVCWACCVCFAYFSSSAPCLLGYVFVVFTVCEWV